MPEGDGRRPNRKAIHVYCSDEAHAAWTRFSMEQGATVSALIEVIAGELDEHFTAEMILEARRLDNERRRRVPRDTVAS